ncbi:MAG: AEC family transporter [Anaerovoracaceae bacterium]|jgi:predicted permease
MDRREPRKQEWRPRGRHFLCYTILIMYQNFIICLQAVLPLFIFILIGMGIRRARLLNQQEVSHLNQMVFQVFFPVMLFNDLYDQPLRHIVNGRLILFTIVVVLGIYFLSVLIVTRIEKNDRSRGALIQAIYRGNFIIMGMPVVGNIYGYDHLGVTMMMISVVIPIYNVLAVITLEIFRGGRIHKSQIFLRILTNPLILGVLAGLAANLCGLHLPKMADSIIGEIAGIASPLALIILGASFRFQAVAHMRRNLSIGLLGKLVVTPGIALTLGMLLGFRDVEFVTLIAIFAAPTAVSSFAMAESMGSDAELAGACVVFSSAFAVLTMFLWLFIFKNIGIF